MGDSMKPPSGISLDLDNLWSYMKIHGDRGWEKYPSYFSIFVPHVLDILDELDIRITFFIVGRDAEIDENKIYLRMITDRGHDVGNHSHNHDPWLQSYSSPEIEREIETAENAIFTATGHKTTGFRGPGFSWSVDLLRVLEKRGYLYDSSSLPTWLGPLARKYYFWKANLSDQEKEDRKELFGRFSEGFRPLKPYYPDLGNGMGILEIPVTTMPLLRVPFHLSYLLYLSRFSPLLMKAWLNKALFFCQYTGVRPAFLLHPLDIIGGDKISELSFFPGMDLPSDRKVDVFKQVLKRFKSSYRLLTMHDFSMEMMKENLRTLRVH
jgi:peptidoglycan-N-acetylglucosamine deacetylase